MFLRLEIIMTTTQINECLALLWDLSHNEGEDDHPDYEQYDSHHHSNDVSQHRELVEFLLEHDFSSPEEEEWFYVSNIIMTILIILCLAIFAGLFVGLMTMDAFQLQIIERSSLDEDERKYATTLYPIIVDRHRLLVTLLVLNALAYETLPLFLDKMVPGWIAILLSTTLVLIFGEIVPSAIFIGYVPPLSLLFVTLFCFSLCRCTNSVKWVVFLVVFFVILCELQTSTTRIGILSGSLHQGFTLYTISHWETRRITA